MQISLVGALCSVYRFRYCQLQKRQTPDTRTFCSPCVAGVWVAHHTCMNIDAPWFISHAVVTLSSRYVTAYWLQDHRRLPFVSSFEYFVTCFQSASLYRRHFGPSAVVTVGRGVDWWYRSLKRMRKNRALRRNVLQMCSERNVFPYGELWILLNGRTRLCTAPVGRLKSFQFICKLLLVVFYSSYLFLCGVRNHNLKSGLNECVPVVQRNE